MCDFKSMAVIYTAKKTNVSLKCSKMLLVKAYS